MVRRPYCHTAIHINRLFHVEHFALPILLLRHLWVERQAYTSQCPQKNQHFVSNKIIMASFITDARFLLRNICRLQLMLPMTSFHTKGTSSFLLHILQLKSHQMRQRTFVREIHLYYNCYITPRHKDHYNIITMTISFMSHSRSLRSAIKVIFYA